MGNGSRSPHSIRLVELSVDQEMLISAFSGAGGAPGAHLCSLPEAAEMSRCLTSAAELRSPGSGPAFHPPPSAARGNATRPRPLPEAGPKAASLAKASPQAPTRAAPRFPGPALRVSPSSSWKFAPPSCCRAPLKGKEVARRRKYV